MSPLFTPLFLIACLFLLMLLVKRITGWGLCAICAAVSTTWIILLVLFWAGRFPHPVIIGVLMGQSTIGVYYLLERKVEKRFHLFRLPFLLTATLGVVAALGEFESGAAWLVAAVWLLFFGVHFLHNSAWGKRIAEHIIACCKNW
jgi:hypothetical protein